MAKIAQGSERLEAWTKDAAPFRRPSSLLLIRTDPSLFLKCFVGTLLSEKREVLLFGCDLVHSAMIRHALHDQHNQHRTVGNYRRPPAA
jgi:hypothetical protein